MLLAHPGRPLLSDERTEQRTADITGCCRPSGLAFVECPRIQTNRIATSGRTYREVLSECRWVSH